jgi:hypothetical protein
MGVHLHLLEVRVQTIQSFTDITRVPQSTTPYAWAWPLVSWHAIFLPSSFRIGVSHQTQGFLLSSLPAARAIQHCASWRRRSMEKNPRSARFSMPSRSVPASSSTRAFSPSW